MKRAWSTLATAVLIGVAAFGCAFFLSQRLSRTVPGSRADDLDWLRQEFNLSDSDLAKVRTLHDGYLPQCGEMCRQIAAKKRELEQALTGATNLSATAEARLVELHTLRARCQSQMLQHFIAVSQAMPPEQGRRYLAEMQRLTLGFHEQIEQSMSNHEGHAHGND